jgi:hypothetical protein
MPVGPFGLPADLSDAAPGEAKTTDTDAIGNGRPVGQNIIELALAGADDDGAGDFGGSQGDDLLALVFHSRAVIEIETLIAKPPFGQGRRGRQGGQTRKQEKPTIHRNTRSD